MEATTAPDGNQDTQYQQTKLVFEKPGNRAHTVPLCGLLPKDSAQDCEYQNVSD